jgi:hypothetical protein
MVHPVQYEYHQFQNRGHAAPFFKEIDVRRLNKMGVLTKNGDENF